MTKSMIKVKQLEWEQKGNTYWESDNSHLHYIISGDTINSFRKREFDLILWEGPRLMDGMKSLKEAKKVAQIFHEKYILSLIDND